MNEALFSSKKMDWRTPTKFFDELNEIHNFTLDAAASDDNAKCKNYFTETTDALSQSWEGHTVFCNPPYGRQIGKWVKKAYEESLNTNTKIVMLIPARTDTSYYHDYIFPHAKVEFLRGRLKFEDDLGIGKDPAPFPSALVIFSK